MRTAPGAFQPLADRRDRMINAKGSDQSIDIEFDGVGAFVADREEGVALLNVGESGGHGVPCYVVPPLCR